MSPADIIPTAVACSALLLSIIALVVQGREANAASRSADEAARSADAAEASARVAEDERARAKERSDVEFVMRRERRSGIFHFENVGSDDAHRVEVVLYVDGKRYAVGTELVEGGSGLVLDADADYRKNVEERRASSQRARAEGLVVMRGAPRFNPESVRISWETRHGTPKVQSILGDT